MSTEVKVLSDIEISVNNTHFTQTEYNNKYKQNEINRWKNMRLTLAQTILISMTIVMTIGNMFDNYTFLVFESSNSWVGYLSTASGIASILFAIPIGSIVDKKDKQKISKITGLLTLLGGALGISAIITEIPVLLFIFVISMAIIQLLGISVMTTIFSDSLTAKERRKYFPLRGSLTFAANTIGPIISIIFFIFVSNTWNVKHLKILLVLSILIIYPSIAFVYFSTKNVDPSLIIEISQDLSQPLSPIENTEEEHKTTENNSNTKSAQAQDTIRRSELKGLAKYNALFNLAANFVRAMGAGMFVKFAPLFFIQEYSFAPIQISILFILLGLCTSVGNFIFQYTAKFLGRPLTSFLSSIFAIICIIGLSFAKINYFSVFFFVFRAFFQNAIRHLDNSFIMDYAEAKNRGKYNSILSFTNVAFGGTAFIGGWLSDTYNYRVTFLATAGVYLSSLFFFLPILFLLPPIEKPLIFKKY